MAQSIGQKFTPFALIRFAFPSMIMMVFMSLYSIVDGIFISRFIGSAALSAANIAYPVQSVLIAVGVMLATGGSAVVAKEIGEGKRKEAEKDFTFITITGLIFSVVYLILTDKFATPVSYLLGSNENLVGYCSDYIRVLMYFAPASMLQMVFQSFFVVAGRPNLGLAVTIIAGITNAALDYVFMGIFGMGIKGAAYATGAGQMIPALAGILYFSVGKKELGFAWFSLKKQESHLHLKKLFQACANGASEMVTNISNAIITYLFNIILMKMAGEDGVAAISIILYAQYLFNAVYMGFSMGVAPVISFNYGAGNKKELKKVVKISKTVVIISSVCVVLLSMLTAETITGIFVPKDTNVYKLAAEGFFLFSFSYLFSGYNIFTSSYFTALSDGKTSAVVSFTRTFGCIVLSLLILPKLFGITGVWLAIPAAELATAGMCVVFHVRERKKNR